MGGKMVSNAVRPALWLSCMLLCILAVSGDVYFGKKGYLQYDATKLNKDIISIEDRINVTFKTVQPMGLLLYGDSIGGSAADYIMLELVGGKLRYAARLGVYGDERDDHEVYLGEDLANGMPHTVSVERIRKEATIRLDPMASDAVVRHVKSSYDQLEIDQSIYVGGAISMNLLEGIKSDTNFMGCIMLASFSHKSAGGSLKTINLLEGSDEKVGVENTCPSEPYRPFTFTKDGAKFVANTGSPDKMVGSFKFRTYSKEGSLLKQKKFKITYSKSAVLLEYEPQRHLSVPFSNPINIGNWLTVEFKILSDKFILNVDGKGSVPGQGMSLDDFFGSSTIFAEDFIGCMRDIKINDKDYHPSDVSESDRPKVQLDKCGISDFCSPNPCLNSGVCTQDGRTFDCTCSSDEGYQGTICQFSKSRQNCGEIKKDDKDLQNGNYTIDPDGSGPVKPFKAFCNMTAEPVETEIWSEDMNVEVVVHPQIEGEKKLSYTRSIGYAPSVGAAKALAQNSKTCRQFIEYGCKKSPLLNSGDYFGRWISSGGVYKNYWGGADPDTKACGCYPNCLDSKMCNCDARRNSWESDKGYIRETSALPVSQVQFGGVNKDKGQEANFTVGNLVCSGEVSNTATFVNEDGMLEIDSWTPASHGDISLYFKTPYARGVLLSNGDLNKEYVQLKITNKTTMDLTFDIGNGARVIATSLEKGELNDREWHKVTFYHNQKEFALEVDGIETKHALDLSKKRDLNTEGMTFVGSDPKALNGFVGCIRGLAVNGKTVDLQTAGNNVEGKSYVKGGCGAACANNYCKLGSTCTDDYNVYRCNCTLTPYYGYFCHKDHGAAFTDDNSQMTYTFDEFVSVPGISLVVGFKPSKCQGQILQVTSKDSDQYFRLEIASGMLIFRYKSTDGDGSIKIPGSFCDNVRHTFALTRMNRQVRYKVDSDDWKVEDLARLDKPFASMYQVIVGSTGDKGYRGCITGVKVAKRLFSEKSVPIEPIEAYLYSNENTATEQIRAQKKNIKVTGITSSSKEKCGEEPGDIPAIPTPRIPDPRTPGPLGGTEGPSGGDGGEGSNTAIIVIVVLILILVIVAVLVAIYWYWSRHKGVYHTHEDDENLKSTDPYIDLVPAKKEEEPQKKKEWYI